MTQRNTILKNPGPMAGHSLMDHIATGDQPLTDNALFWVCQAIAGGQPAPVKNHFEPFWTHQAAAGDHCARPASLGEEPFWVDQKITMMIKHFFYLIFQHLLLGPGICQQNSSTKYHFTSIKQAITDNQAVPTKVILYRQKFISDSSNY